MSGRGPVRLSARHRLLGFRIDAQGEGFAVIKLPLWFSPVLDNADFDASLSEDVAGLAKVYGADAKWTRHGRFVRVEVARRV
jgi:hypothetical protein